MLTYETASPITDHGSAKTPWFSICLAVVRKQIAAEVFGMPGYRFTLKGPPIQGFVASPHELRPASQTVGKAMMAGRFALAGGRMSVQGSGDPWNRPSPNRAFALELHKFAWLAPMMTQGYEGAREALRLFILWQATFKTWTPFSWSEEVLSRRLINLAIYARRLSYQADPQDVQLLAQSMAEQARHLRRLPVNWAYYAQRAVALILVGSVLEGRAGDDLRASGLKALPKALKKTVLVDGAHASRSPQQALDLIYDLLMIEDTLAQRALAQPPSLAPMIEKLCRFVRTLTHPDGSLCGFQGSESLTAEQMAGAFVHEDSRPKLANALPQVLEHGRYHRLQGRSLSVFVDVGWAKHGPFGYGACDHAFNFEVSGGFDKLIVANGWSPLQGERPAMRIMGAANSLTLAESSILSPISGRFAELLHFALFGYRYRVRHRRLDSEASGSLLEMEHEGWRPAFGLKHERRFYLDATRDELRGEDRLMQVETKPELPMGVPYVVRFLLHPDVQASLARDKKSILLKAPGGRGWWLRHDSREVDFENGMVFERGVMRKSTVIALKGVCRLDGVTKVRWKLAAAEA